MPREGINNQINSKHLKRLTGTLSPRFTAADECRVSNLSGAPPSKEKAPDKAGTKSSAGFSNGAEIEVKPTREGRAAQ